MPDAIRIASVPASHVYVRHLGWPGDGVSRLPDPPSRVNGWWPPGMLSPDWIESNRERFDLFHIHFGFDALNPRQLRAVCRTLQRHDKPLVYTAHDLRNPHQPDPVLHDKLLGVLVEESDALLTLTKTASRQLRERFGRAATVVPHPHVVPFNGMKAPAKADGREVVVGVHLKSLRANMVHGLMAIEQLARSNVPDVRIQVNVHREIWDGPGGGLTGRLERLAFQGRIDLQVHDYFSETEFFRYLERLDVSFLPYAFGTHSGWLEACRDLGTAVIVPDCGCYADQGDVDLFRTAGGRPVEESVREALLAAVGRVRSGGIEPVGPSMRAEQRKRIAARHRLIYTRLLERRGVGPRRSGTSRSWHPAPTSSWIT